MTATDHYPGIHTKVLLGRLTSIRAAWSNLCLYHGADEDNWKFWVRDHPGLAPWEAHDPHVFVDWQSARLHEYIERLKETLATREHVPNKQEGKRARQAAAKAGSRRGRRDR